MEIAMTQASKAKRLHSLSIKVTWWARVTQLTWNLPWV